MAEENKPVEGEQAAPEPQLTAIELKASEQGWVPQDEWAGEPDAWRPAKEFLDRGELFKKIDDQNRTIKEFKRALDDLAKHHKKTAEVEYKRALEALKAQKKEALVEGDFDAVVDIDERIGAVREAQANIPEVVVQEPAQVNPVFANWVERNQWYKHDDVMQAYADKIGNKLGAEGMNPVEILSEVERQVKEKFKEKFSNPRRSAPAAVEGGGARGGKKSDSFQLTDEERRVMQRFVRTGALTEEAYIAELKKQKGVA
jgi:hypothetical protein